MFALIAALALMALRPAVADVPTDRPVELFNGKDLTGWVSVNGAADTWAVRDGIIVTTGKPKGFLRTDRMYENYVLDLEWRHVAKGGNAGLFVHADALPQVGAPYPKSVEVQVMDGDHGSVFGIRGCTLTPLGKIRGRRALASEDRARPAGEWNHYRLTARDGTLELAVNGATVTRAKDVSQVKGYIALEAEGTECHFRNIRLTPLPSGNPPADKAAAADQGVRSIFDGLSFAGWKYLDNHQGHWIVRDGVIHYDGKAAGGRTDRDVWTEKAYRDFVLVADWRLPSKPEMKPHPVVLPNGDFVFDEQGRRKTTPKLDAGDSGIYLRGSRKAQLNIWSQDLGSGEINGYRTDRSQPADVRLACIPSKKADTKFGQWNRFEVTLRGERVTVVLNGETVIENARLPGVPAAGPIGLQHHGDPVEFRNLFVKELD
jgi:hypothetical protein